MRLTQYDPHQVIKRFIFSFCVLFFIMYFMLQLRENTLFPDGSSVEFRCHEETQLFPGHDYALEGNSSLTCHDGHWNSRLPYCRKTASARANYSGICILNEMELQLCKFWLGKFFIFCLDLERGTIQIDLLQKALKD